MQGEDLAVWIAAQRTAWDRLVPAQQYLLETVGVDPAEGEPVRPVARSQDDRWTANLTAAKQFHAREGHLMVPRKHVEIVDGTEHRLGAWLDNTRRRAAKLSEQRRADLDALNMRW